MLAVGFVHLAIRSWWCLAQFGAATFMGVWCHSLIQAGTKEAHEELQREIVLKQQAELNAAAMKWVTNNDPRTTNAPRTAEDLLKAVAAQDSVKMRGGF